MLFVFIIGILAILLDQISKIIVTSKMSLYQSITVFDNFFYINYVRNDGIAWGINVKLWLLILITVLALLLFVWLSKNLSIKKDKWYIITLGLLFGGTIGNFIDRIFQSDHSVVDFLSFILYYPSFKGGLHFKSYFFPVFNIADTFLVIGTIMFIIYFLFIEPKKNKKNKEESNEEIIEVK